MTEDPTLRHAVRASDAERDAAVARLQSALAEGRITVDEFGERAQAAYAATTTDQLGPLLADLPARAAAAQVEVVGSRPPATLVSVMGAVRLDARSALPRRVRTGFGDIRVDLRDLRTDAEVVELELTTVLGDVDVVVAEGVDAELDGWTVIGKREVE